MAEGGETFVLDMGEPVRIVDLVYNYAAEFHVPASAVSIRYTGLRPGEKLNEALFSETEQRFPTSHPRIWSTRPVPAVPGFSFHLERLVRAAFENHADEVRQCLTSLLPRYTPAETDVADAAAVNTPYPDGF